MPKLVIGKNLPGTCRFVIPKDQKRQKNICYSLSSLFKVTFLQKDSHQGLSRKYWAYTGSFINSFLVFTLLTGVLLSKTPTIARLMFIFDFQGHISSEVPAIILLPWCKSVLFLFFPENFSVTNNSDLSVLHSKPD